MATVVYQYYKEILFMRRHTVEGRIVSKEWIINYAEPVYDSNGDNVFGSLCFSGGRLNAYYVLLG